MQQEIYVCVNVAALLRLTDGAKKLALALEEGWWKLLWRKVFFKALLASCM